MAAPPPPCPPSLPVFLRFDSLSFPKRVPLQSPSRNGFSSAVLGGGPARGRPAPPAPWRHLSTRPREQTQS
eukprot:8600966-Pyramimonas_sp.AAC.1